MAAMRNLPCFRRFRSCEDAHKVVSSGPSATRKKQRQAALAWLRDLLEIMDESVQKSCWSLTAKAVIGIAGLILLVWLVGGSETSAMLAAK